MSRNTRTFRAAVTAAVAVATIAPAAASARFDLNPYVPLPTPAPAVPVVRESGGFDWGDAGIGAAAGVGASILAVGGSLTTKSRRSRRTVNPTAVGTS